MLSDLLAVSEADPEAMAASTYLNSKQRKDKMTELYNDYKNWRKSTVEETKKKSRTEVNITEVDTQTSLLLLYPDLWMAPLDSHCLLHVYLVSHVFEQLV